MRMTVIGWLMVALLGWGAAAARGQVMGNIIGIDPDPFVFELTAGGQAQASVTVEFTVPVETQVDVLFLTDTTLSMEEYIGPIQSAYRIATRSLLGNDSLNLQFAIADYKDFGAGGGYDDRGYGLQQKFTRQLDEALAGINDLFIGGGNGGPEQNLAALGKVGRDWFELGGRPDAEKVIVWLGDAPGFEDFGPYPSLSNATKTLMDLGAQVFAFNPFKAGAGIDAEGAGPNTSGLFQASTIAEATNGQALNSFPIGNVDILSGFIENVVEEVGQVSPVSQISLEVDGDLGGWGFFAPPISGPFEPSPEPYIETFDLFVTAPELIELVSADLIFAADDMSLDRLSESQQQIMQFLFACILGDMNGDSLVDAFDVGLFELALADKEAYEATVPIDADEWGDLNGDGRIDAFDVALFEAAVAGTASGTLHAPEPGSAVCLAWLIWALPRRGGRRAGRVAR